MIGSLHRTRLAAVGSEQDMVRLCGAMLASRDWLDTPDDRPPLSLKELLAQIAERTQWEAGDQPGFLYGMVAPAPYGDAVPESCEFSVTQTTSGLYLAGFAYDSYSRFQTEDWLSLHVRCDRLPMFALHADTDFALDKGLVLFSGGEAHDNWDLMAESWLWLIDHYESGISPEEIVQRLTRLKNAMLREDWDQSITEVLTSCAENLRTVEEKGHVTPDMLADAKTRRDFAELYELQARIADTFLWDSDRHVRDLACLTATAEAWGQRD